MKINVYTSIVELLQLFVPPLVPIIETIAIVLNINTATYIAVFVVNYDIASYVVIFKIFVFGILTLQCHSVGFLLVTF